MKSLLPSLKLKPKQKSKLDEVDETDPIIYGNSLSYDYLAESNPLVVFYRSGIFIISILFSFLLIVNAFYNMRLRNVLNLQSEYITKISQLQDIETDALSVSSKINYYKNILGSRSEVLEDITYLNQAVSGKASVTKMYFDASEFDLTITVENSQTFSLLIEELLKERVSYLVIQSATYNSSEDYYSVVLKGRFIDD